MAVTTTKLPNTAIGITYSVITDSSSDWPSVSNDVYFYDKATDLPYYKNSSGTVVSLFEEGGGGGSTIYTSDGTLTGNRIVDLNSNTLKFEDGQTYIDSGSFNPLVINRKGSGTLGNGIDFNAYNSSNAETNFARIIQVATDVTAGSEDGGLWLRTMIGGTLRTPVRLDNRELLIDATNFTDNSFRVVDGSTECLKVNANKQTYIESGSFNPLVINRKGLGNQGNGIDFNAYNSSNAEHNFARVIQVATNNTAGSEDGGLWLRVSDGGSITTKLTIGADTSSFEDKLICKAGLEVKGLNTSYGGFPLKVVNGSNVSLLEVRNNGAFIVGGSAIIGTEDISLQGDTLITKKLELSTTTDGFLMPRLTTAQKNAISSPDTNLMVFDTDLASIERYDGANWVAQANYGLISINDSNGTPVFYNNLNGAISAASGGQTIELHGDVVESSNTMITIDKELTINMNGYMYSCTSTGTADAVYINTSSKVKILNGTIKRSGGTYGGTSNRTLVVASDSNLELTGTDIINTTGISLYSTGADTNILNGKFITTGQTISQVSVQSVANITGSIFESSAYNNFNGVLFNVKATSTSTNVLKGGYANFCEFRQTNASGYDAILLTNGSKGVHCKAYNVSTNYPAIRISGANTEINFCYGYSTLDNGIEVASGTPKGIYDCIGVNVSGANKYGGQISSLEDGVYNSTFIGLGGYGALYNTGTDNKFVKCNFVNKNSSVSNAAFYDTSAGTVRVYDCFSEQADSSKPNLRFTNALRVVYLAGNKLQGGTGVSIAHVDGNSQNTSTDDYGNIILS